MMIVIEWGPATAFFEKRPKQNEVKDYSADLIYRNDRCIPLGQPPTNTTGS